MVVTVKRYGDFSDLCISFPSQGRRDPVRLPRVSVWSCSSKRFRVVRYPFGMCRSQVVDIWHYIVIAASSRRLRAHHSSVDERAKNSISRSLQAVKHIGLSNKWDYFVTFTLSPRLIPDRSNYSAVFRHMSQKIRDLRKVDPEYKFDYLLVPELHANYDPEWVNQYDEKTGRGFYHFHGLLSNINPDWLVINEHGYLDFPEFRKRFGWVSISPVKNSTAAAFYCCKYVSKNLGAVKKNDCSHLYFCSQGLNRPQTVRRCTRSKPEAGLPYSILKTENYQVTEYGTVYRHQMKPEDADRAFDLIRTGRWTEYVIAPDHFPGYAYPLFDIYKDESAKKSVLKGEFKNAKFYSSEK